MCCAEKEDRMGSKAERKARSLEASRYEGIAFSVVMISV